MAYEVVVMSGQCGNLASGGWITHLEVNGTATTVTTPGHKGLDYHREMVEHAINKLSKREVK